MEEQEWHRERLTRTARLPYLFWRGRTNATKRSAWVKTRGCLSACFKYWSKLQIFVSSPLQNMFIRACVSLELIVFQKQQQCFNTGAYFLWPFGHLQGFVLVFCCRCGSSWIPGWGFPACSGCIVPSACCNELSFSSVNWLPYHLAKLFSSDFNAFLPPSAKRLSIVMQHGWDEGWWYVFDKIVEIWGGFLYAAAGSLYF